MLSWRAYCCSVPRLRRTLVALSRLRRLVSYAVYSVWCKLSCCRPSSNLAFPCLSLLPCSYQGRFSPCPIFRSPTLCQSFTEESGNLHRTMKSAAAVQVANLSSGARRYCVQWNRSQIVCQSCIENSDYLRLTEPG